MDTWATSSLTPQIAGGWDDDPDLFARVFPMDLRPQAHDIIRTWLFSTVLRAHLEHDSLPWTNAAISGWVLDPDRKKMSKSKGNVVTPMALLEEHGSDGVRYWAASGRPGHRHRVRHRPDAGRPAARDQAAERVEVRARASPSRAGRSPSPVDRGMLTQPRARSCATATDAARGLRLRARARADRDVLLVVLRRLPRAREGAPLRRPGRRRSPRRPTARCWPRCPSMLRLFAPFLPFVTEEVWSWWQRGLGAPRAVADAGRARVGHRRRRTTARRAVARAGGARAGAKSARRSRRPSSRSRRRSRALIVRDAAAHLEALRADVDADLLRGRASSSSIELVDGDAFGVEVDAGAAAGVMRSMPLGRSSPRSIAIRPPRARRGRRRGRRHDRGDRAGRRDGRAASSWPSADCVLAGLDVAAAVVPPARSGAAVCHPRVADGDRVRAGHGRRRGDRAGRARC